MVAGGRQHHARAAEPDATGEAADVGLAGAPAAFAVAVGVAVDRVESATSWTRRRPFAWLLPAVLIAAAIPTLFALAVAVPILAVWVAIREEAVLHSLRATRTVPLVIRGAWLAVALLGLVALLGDIAELRRVV
jgi:hypothetical protein